MKKSEKEELLKFIDESKCLLCITEPNIEIINIEYIKEAINNMPTEKDDVKEVYAIRDLSTGDIIWSARGSAYKELDDVKKKIRKLKCLAQNKDKEYKIITYKLEDDVNV